MAVVSVTPLALRILLVCGLLAAPLASCGGDSKHQSRGSGGSGGAAGTNTQTGGSSGSVSGGGHSAGGSSSGGRGGTAGDAAAAGGTPSAGAGGSATAGKSGSSGAPSGGTSGSGGSGGTGGSAEAGAGGDGGAAGAPEPALYSGCQYGSGAGRILIAKEQDAKCTVLILVRPGNETLGLELPPGIGVEAAFRSAPAPAGCFIYSPPSGAAEAISGSGTIPQLAIKLDVDVTLQFPAGEEPPSETLSVQDLDTESRCP